ncbi:MAG: hypothetical protein DRP09_14230 [Candidatus Thorarchaeota archaeon]|nr:MAG: hypothetical protein DRP09_14230 [Candidatus Thorarchaeota archaeon]
MPTDDEITSFDDVFPPKKKHYQVREVAEAIGVHRDTIVNWCRQAKIKITRTGKGKIRILSRRRVKKLFEAVYWPKVEAMEKAGRKLEEG